MSWILESMQVRSEFLGDYTQNNQKIHMMSKMKMKANQ